MALLLLAFIYLTKAYGVCHSISLMFIARRKVVVVLAMKQSLASTSHVYWNLFDSKIRFNLR